MHSVIDADNAKNFQKLWNSPQWMLSFKIADFLGCLERSTITWYWLHVYGYHSEADSHPYEKLTTEITKNYTTLGLGLCKGWNWWLNKLWWLHQNRNSARIRLLMLSRKNRWHQYEGKSDTLHSSLMKPLTIKRPFHGVIWSIR